MNFMATTHGAGEEDREQGSVGGVAELTRSIPSGGFALTVVFLSL
jgi:hypothetical protein